MMATADVFRVWVGCLACYNSGRLVGAWHDAAGAGELTPEDVHDGAENLRRLELRDGGAPHEELWCFDIENAPEGYRREMSPMEASEIAERLEELDDDAGAFAAWCANNGESLTTADVDEFRERYAGIWDDFQTFAYQLEDDQGLFVVSPGRYAEPFTLPDDHPLVSYFDHDGWARDLLLGGDYFTMPAPDYAVYVFRSYKV